MKICEWCTEEKERFGGSPYMASLEDMCIDCYAVVYRQHPTEIMPFEMVERKDREE
jgi:hypothetical protein